MKPTEPEILAFQARCEAFYPPDAVEAPVARQREWYDALCREFDSAYPPGVEAADGAMGTGKVPVRRYRPERAVEGRAVVLYLHGGGFVVGSLDSHDGICAEFAARSGAELVAVDYRLAPEHPFPAAFQDCADVFAALAAEGRPVVLAGDSAGGNLAAGLALLARDRKIADVVGQVLIYPGLGGDLERGSFIEMATAPGLTTQDVAFYRRIYGAPEDDPYAHPLRATDLSGLPPAYVTVAHFDPLRDDGREYAARLASAGVSVCFREEPQMIHAWMRARHMSPGASKGFDGICAALEHFASSSSAT